MPITTRCPECGTKYRLDEKHLDRQAKCKNGHVFKVIPEAQIVEDPQPVIPEETAVESVPRSTEPVTPQQAQTSLFVMERFPRWLHWVIVLNLLLWVVVAGRLIRGHDPSVAMVAWLGVGLAGVLQHWEYYQARRGSTRKAPSPSDGAAGHSA